ncbi:uncharacterized protein LOC129594698 [Paramacrobiotus metropolitanus]|uniref:uncharacterized protein LOC129594698 n=1 Tax=Paramacrobiotus metropolitanus TaxID=2943436 RepID=UPI0024465A85|nr:uncharacterized protein LOC129594698 [Paramacrobiotus metropolitanus]
MKLLRAVWVSMVLFVLPSGFLQDAPTDLEIDCNTPPTATQISAVQLDPNPFRTDLLTREECLGYVSLHESRSICSPVQSRKDCEPSSNDQYTITPISRTYIEVLCSWENRTSFAEITQSVSTISQRRAVTIRLKERNDSTDPIHSDVVNPIREQIIELSILECRTTRTTAKVYDAGMLPNVIRFTMQSGLRLEIQKKDFSRMPKVRMISLSSCTVAVLEPYTFTDLPHLQSLSLEDGVGFHLRRLQMHPNRSEWDPETFGEDDLAMVWKLHCDCSYAWYRNFLKKIPSLITGKNIGEIGSIGNYKTPYVGGVSSLSGLLSVNCTHKLTPDNSDIGSKYSYNVPCYNIQC